jgi:hypothetical protein
MKIYRLEPIGNPMNDSFASCMCMPYDISMKPNTHPKWKWGRLCPHCGSSIYIEVLPLQMFWGGRK